MCWIESLDLSIEWLGEHEFALVYSVAAVGPDSRLRRPMRQNRLHNAATLLHLIRTRLPSSSGLKLSQILLLLKLLLLLMLLVLPNLAWLVACRGDVAMEHGALHFFGHLSVTDWIAVHCRHHISVLPQQHLLRHSTPQLLISYSQWVCVAWPHLWKRLIWVESINSSSSSWCIDNCIASNDI